MKCAASEGPLGCGFDGQMSTVTVAGRPQFEKPERLGYDLFRDFALLLEG